MKFFLDRIEGDFCVFICNGTTIDIPKTLFDNIKEGDVYHFIKDSNQNTDKTNEELVNKLFK